MKEETDKMIYLGKVTDWNPDTGHHKFFLETFDKQQIEVCRNFFVTTLKIGNSALTPRLERIKKLSHDFQSSPPIKGKYSVQ